ncbi:MAG: manganese catalase family protein [Hyphomonadaceae bacterium]|nr:manganese catalase family protein [Clostridia bacterium]
MRLTDTDTGTEELAHLEIIATMVFKLTNGATVKELEAAGMGEFYVNHGHDLFYTSAAGNPFTVEYIAAKGDAIANLHENMAAEQKARATYEHLIDMTDDPCVIDVLRFLREREVVHFQRFGEALRVVQEFEDSKKIF